MDALPITETTGLAYASTAPGVMHACGHDGHTASLLGAAALLMRDTSWTGTVQLVFQPAEEGYGGAKAMLADGLFERFPMERIFGYHNWPGLEAGTVMVHDGAVMAAGARLEIVIDGHAGHAAMPHLTRDPMLAAAHLLIALQSVVSRNVDPLDSAVVSDLHGGRRVGVQPDPGAAVMTGTFRTHRRAVRDLVEARSAGWRTGSGGPSPCRSAWTSGTACRARSTARRRRRWPRRRRAMGAAVRRDMAPTMAGEDFGWYLEQRPGAFAWIGNGPARRAPSCTTPATTTTTRSCRSRPAGLPPRPATRCGLAAALMAPAGQAGGRVAAAQAALSRPATCGWSGSGWRDGGSAIVQAWCVARLAGRC